MYFVAVLIASAKNDRFNWLSIVWPFVIGLPRVILYFMTCKHSIDSFSVINKYAKVMVGLTALQLILFIIDLFEIFLHEANLLCDRVYAVYYMRTEWDIECSKVIFYYEICMVAALVFYIYATY